MRFLTTIACFLFICVLTISLSATPPHALYLKQRFQEAQPGDYVVVHQNRTYTLFHIFEKSRNAIVIEEITIPDNQLPQLRKKNTVPFSWKTWIQQASPKRTCWAMYEVQLLSGKISEYYSFSQQSWLDLSKTENFLPTLLNLKFTPIPPEARRKIGAPPLAGEADTRRLWQPVLTINGKVVRRASFDAWEAKWPSDKSPLAGRTVVIYLPSNTADAPSYFPYWIEIPDSPGEDKIRVIDSGKGMHSPMKVFPKRLASNLPILTRPEPTVGIKMVGEEIIAAAITDKQNTLLTEY